MAGTLQVIFIRELTTGGQGVIWEAQLTDGTPVAVKIPRPSPTAIDPDGDRRRFEREIRCQTNLNHPGIVRVLATGKREGESFYVMPWAETTLRSRLRDPFDDILLDEAVQIFEKIVDAMAYAHTEGILHRDLKPENILFFNGEPKLADFGLGRQVSSESATITVTNAMLGTLEYMPPEQYADGHSATAASDVFSLGKIFYELLTGRIPFPFTDESLIPTKYRYFVSRCIEQQPDRRFRDALEMRAQLDALRSPTRELASPEAQAKALLEEIKAGNRTAYGALSELLLQNQSDSNLFLSFLPYLPANVVKTYGSDHQVDFVKIVSTFLDYVDGSHPFSFTDTLADFLDRAYWAINPISVRKNVLAALLRLAYSHNRFYVGNVFVDVVKRSISDEHLNSMIADVLNEHPTELEFVQTDLKNLSLPKVVRDIVEPSSGPFESDEVEDDDEDPWEEDDDDPWAGYDGPGPNEEEDDYEDPF